MKIWAGFLVGSLLVAGCESPKSMEDAKADLAAAGAAAQASAEKTVQSGKESAEKFVSDVQRRAAEAQKVVDDIRRNKELNDAAKSFFVAALADGKSIASGSLNGPMDQVVTSAPQSTAWLRGQILKARDRSTGKEKFALGMLLERLDAKIAAAKHP